ncbi:MULTISPECIES: MFS transporter [Kitasatospora]|uniref:Putative drug resistance protein n=1 Tax=Kitasatospora setae (strain ATCC 33774 / DSM 43861 / JCM 3304 / KCC A-0304 / NBRC 14216 / KM-6054) TaxID=452652 RepID=E4NIS5_KITSK|nr:MULTISPECIES: MFS transporter [Kitasatospora]BAJ32873.1 putative drug resistance protein [Kitasatospora setae KM-6054]
MLTKPTAPAPALSRGRRWAALAVLSASLLVITMDMTILNIALPSMAAELHPTSAQQLWLVDVYSLVLAGLLVSVAAIADRWGRKRMLMLGYAVFAGASLLVLAADTAGEVIAVRALLGIGGAMVMPTTLSLIRVVFTDPKERATALSIWASVSGLGAVVGPLVGGFLLDHFSWHAAFLVNVPLMAVGIVAALFLLTEPRSPNPGRWDAPAALLSLVGMVALVWAIKQFGEESSLAVPSAWAALALAAITLTWFVRRCLRSDHPLLDLGLFKNRQFSALVAPILSRRIGSRIGSRAVLAGGLALAGVGMLYLRLVGGHLTLTHMTVALCLVGAGTGALAIGSAMIMGGAPTEKAGNAGALKETAYEFGGTLGVTILGSIATLLFRAQFTDSPQYDALHRADPALADQARESLGAAVTIADELHLPGLATHATDAFTHSLQSAGLIGGLLMLAVAATVFFLTPKGTEVSGTAH